MSGPLVALVGRTNVGKSLLWNRLTETGRALVSEEPHTTRDRNYGIVLWKGLTFQIVDTGGMDTAEDEMGQSIRAQAERAIKEADLVLFLVDAQAGLLPQDRKLAKRIKPWNKHIWLTANKTDKPAQLALANQPEFYRLNFGAPRPLSAATGFGSGDLLDDMLLELERLGHPAMPTEETKAIRVAIIGRPNVGKSSLVNAILGEERVIVSPIPHTTREPQDTPFMYKERDLVLIDTAGMRHRAKIKTEIEEQGIERNERAIANSDVACLVFDVTQNPTAQDRALAGMLEETGKGLILVGNKWDLIPAKTTETAQKFEKLIRQLFPFLDWAPMVFVSALKHQRTNKVLDLVLQIQEERYRHIDYNAINRLLKSCIKIKKPLASYGPKSPRIYDVAQIGSAPPTFLITVHGEKENVHPNWVKFFERRVREKFGFVGTPIVVKVRHLSIAKTLKRRNIHGPGMEAVAGKLETKKPRIHQTRRRWKMGGRRY